jgi:hypothetical protein
MAGATPATAAGTGEPDSASKGMYLEAQTGVAPSQSHVFPLPKNASVEWTEWFRPFQADKQRIHSSNYSEALDEVESWLDSAGGVPQPHFEEMEKFLEAHSADPIKPENILTHGLPWGGLQEALTGAKLAEGVWFDTPAESLAAAAAAKPGDADAAMVASAVQPWHELLTGGTFSNESLGRLPGSFQVAQSWYELLQDSVQKHGATWLHHLMIGTIELERAHSKQAAGECCCRHRCCCCLYYSALLLFVSSFTCAKSAIYLVAGNALDHSQPASRVVLRVASCIAQAAAEPTRSTGACTTCAYTAAGMGKLFRGLGCTAANRQQCRWRAGSQRCVWRQQH